MMNRRAFLISGLGALGAVAVSRPLYNALTDDGDSGRTDDAGPSDTGDGNDDRRNDNPFGPLGDADDNGLRLPDGFRSRVIATTGQAVAGTAVVWHGAPDGGACFPAGDDGWVYVSNSEVGNNKGGVTAVEFAADGDIVDARQVLLRTNRNCAGGPTPWGTWLSCEEYDEGLVWECDPAKRDSGVALPALGTFQHEAAAVDLANGHVYLTEDESDGRYYRFTPDRRTDSRLDLTSGRLEVAEVAGDDKAGRVEWLPVPNPNPKPGEAPTRRQVPGSTRFEGGEGAWFHNGHVYWATKGDNRVYDYDTAAATMRILYDAEKAENPVLKGVDNVTVTPTGDVLVAEDGDNMQLCMIVLTGAGDPLVVPVVEIVGHRGSEVTGPAFSPDGTRLYFSSQRGPADSGNKGVTFEVTGPWERA